MTSAMLIDLWFTVTGIAAIALTLAQLVFTAINLRNNP